MMRSLYSGVSGLKNHQTRMDVIGNNISNVNTYGYKAARATFTDMLSQSLSGASSPNGNVGGTNPKQIGLGSSVGSIETIFTNGSVQSTGKNTDLCLSSENALFILNTGSGVGYTRNGAFEFDADGNYVQAGNGYYVQGWMADDGVLTTTGGVGNITIPSGKQMESKATTAANYSNNLNSETTGYKIGGITVNYTDGTSETTTNYSPTENKVGTITLEMSTGEKITLDNTAAYDFEVGQSIDGKNLNKSKIISVTANTPGTVDLKCGMGTAVNSIDSSTTYSVTGLDTGSYSIDGTYTLSGTITKVVAHGTNDVDVTVDIGGGKTKVVNVPYPDSFTYAVGDAFSVGLPIQSIAAKVGAEVTTENGETSTTTAALTVNTKDDEYQRKGTAADGTITAISRTGSTNYTYNGKQVSTVNITTADGNNVSGLIGASYAKNGTFYPSVVTIATVYGSEGAAHDVSILLTKTDQNEWKLSLAGGGNTSTITEDDGSQTMAAISATPLKFDETGRYVSGDATLTLSYTNGEADQTIAIDLSALTQYASSNTVDASTDGNAPGTLSGISIDTSGIITGTYTNGVKQAEAQVAVQRFTNPAGLTKIGDSIYEDSNNAGKSGEPNTAAAIGAKITPAALEMSTVDIADQFTDMITTQRGFQSNSKTITVSDEMLETLINMKR